MNVRITYHSSRLTVWLLTAVLLTGGLAGCGGDDASISAGERRFNEVSCRALLACEKDFFEDEFDSDRVGACTSYVDSVSEDVASTLGDSCESDYTDWPDTKEYRAALETCAADLEARESSSLCRYVEEDPEEIIMLSELKSLSEPCKEASTKEQALTRKVSRECDVEF
ncbi:MAG: hypothetical protein HYY13_11105 [Nitrospirae bacterium]|nr:hypothetical protein [Nitrospirota bacterium]